MPAQSLRVLAHLRPARHALARVLAAGLVEGLLTVAQAVAVGSLVVAVVTDPASGELGRLTAWVVAVVALRALASYVVEVSASTAAGQVSTAMRHRLLDAMTRLDPARLARHRTGELALWATRGTAAVRAVPDPLRTCRWSWPACCRSPRWPRSSGSTGSAG